MSPISPRGRICRARSSIFRTSTTATLGSSRRSKPLNPCAHRPPEGWTAEIAIWLAEGLRADRQVVDFGAAPPLYRGALGLRATSGRLAQRESTPFTRVGSLVQSQYRPPFPGSV